MELSLAGHIALVTGASRLAGIGAATARLFAAAGADIAFTHWTPYDRTSYGTTSFEPEILANELREMGVRAEGIEVDLSDASSPAGLFETVEARLGPVGILVNNAAYSRHDDHETLTAESLDRHYAVNVRAMALLSVEFTRRFTAGNGGRIINLTSGQSVAPMPTELSYATTKGAIEAFTTSLAPGVARKGITVNAVDPGGTDTGWMTDDFKAAITA